MVHSVFSGFSKNTLNLNESEQISRFSNYKINTYEIFKK